MPLNNPSIGLDPLQVGGIDKAKPAPQFEDFSGYSTSAGADFLQFWQGIGANGVDFALADAIDHPGIIEVLSGVAPSVEILTFVSPTFALPNAFWQCAMIARIPVLSVAAQAFAARYGIMNQASAAQPTDGVYFEHSQLSANWLATCRNGGVQTQVDTGVAVVANAFANLSVTVAGVGNPAVFSINGNVVASIGTNLPAGNNLGPGVQIQKTNGATIMSIHVDTFYFGYAFAALR